MGSFTGYLKTWFKKKGEEVKDPEIEIEQAIQEAQERDRQLRNQAAKVIAHRTQVDQQLDEAVDNLAEAKELAKQALIKADAAQAAGNAADATKWNQAAQTLAMRMQAAQNNVEMLKSQLQIADQQAEQAKQAVANNAMQLQEIAAKRMQLLGQLQAAKMQESVNNAMSSLNAGVAEGGVSLESVEDKINARLAEASARAELRSATPEGAMQELQQAVSMTKADATLDALRAELGMGKPAELEPPAPGQLPAATPPAPDAPA